MSKRHHLDCGCRPSTVRSKGHRPGCALFDMERFVARRNVAHFRRRWAERGASVHHARDVILGR